MTTEGIEREVIAKLERAILKRPGITYRELLQNSHLLAENLKRVLTSMEADELIWRKGKKYYHL